MHEGSVVAYLKACGRASIFPKGGKMGSNPTGTANGLITELIKSVCVTSL